MSELFCCMSVVDCGGGGMSCMGGYGLGFVRPVLWILAYAGMTVRRRVGVTVRWIYRIGTMMWIVRGLRIKSAMTVRRCISCC